MKILVTGAGGFLGRYVVRRLHEAGHEVVPFDRAGLGLSAADGKCERALDLLAREFPAQAIAASGAEGLVHLAWYTRAPAYWTSPLNIDWVAATARLVDVFVSSGGRRVLVAGSCAEYSWLDGSCDEARTPLEPVSLYGAAKLASAQLARQICVQAGASFYWGRIFFPYGPGESEGRLVPHLLGAMMRGEVVHCSHGMQRRDYIHAADVAGAIAHLMTADCPSGAYNVSLGRTFSIREIVAACRSVTGSDADVVFEPMPSPADAPAELLGINRKLLATGWNPLTTLEDGLRSYVEYMRPHVCS